MNTITKIINKAALILILSAVFCIAFAASNNVYAGGGYSMPELKGPDAKGEITPGTIVKILFTDLENEAPGITSDPQVEKYFAISTSDDFTGSVIRVDALESSQEGGYYFIKIDKQEYCDKYLRFYTGHPTDTGLNNNSNPYYIKPNVLHLNAGPEILGIKCKGSLLSKEIVVTISTTPAKYNTDIDPTWRFEDKRTIKLYSNGTLVGTQKNSNYNTTFTNVPVKYGTDNTVTVQLCLELDGMTIDSKPKSFTVPAESLGTPTAYATKISSKQVALSWTTVQGATGYEIYKGSKKVKTVGDINRYTVKGKGAGKSKYRVVAILNQDGQVYKGSSSNTVKPQKNEIKFNRSVVYTSTSYATCPFRITKISLNGSTYTVTGYAVNNRIFKMKRYKNLRVGLYVNGKKAFNKKYKSRSVNCRASGSKKIVLKVKGKKGVDLRNGGTITYIEGGTPVW
ncbi:MAG: hypothetical protein IKE52_00995 [Mogibacterium sp.]|nr:hypothetical protein [Mogibacterium sp.]